VPQVSFTLGHSELGFFLYSVDSHNILGFQIVRPEHHCRDIICRIAHLVHQNLYRMNFTFNPWVEASAGEVQVP
jgi:hypothetical protein